MQLYFFWLIVGIVLIGAELATGTFYLLFLGIAALVGAAAAFLAAPLWAQTVVAAACAVSGVLWVQRYRRSLDQPPMQSLDVGQTVMFESWTDQAGKRARVRYRDADWDAQVSGDCEGRHGERLYIVAVHGSLLEVARQQPK